MSHIRKMKGIHGYRTVSVMDNEITIATMNRGESNKIYEIMMRTVATADVTSTITATLKTMSLKLVLL